MPKITLFAAFVLVCSVAAFADAAQPAGHPDTSGWQDVFNADLSNAVCPKGVWAWKNGELSANKDIAIFSDKDCENVAIDFEFKQSPGSNSGLIFYASDVRNWIPHSIEIQIADTFGTPTGQSVCGAIYGHVAPRKQLVKKPGEWNRMTVTCRGPLVSVVLNGEPACETDLRQYTSAEKNPDGSAIPKYLSTPLAQLPTKGRIGLQGRHYDRGQTVFRNIKIKELD